MTDLVEDKSWDLFFFYHGFPHKNGNISNMNEKTTKLVCAKCGGLPLAIKVIGRSMAGIAERESKLTFQSQIFMIA